MIERHGIELPFSTKWVGARSWPPSTAEDRKLGPWGNRWTCDLCEKTVFTELAGGSWMIGTEDPIEKSKRDLETALRFHLDYCCSYRKFSPTAYIQRDPR